MQNGPEIHSEEARMTGTHGKVVLPFAAAKVTGDSRSDFQPKVATDSAEKSAQFIDDSVVGIGSNSKSITPHRVTGDSQRAKPSKPKTSARRVTGDSRSQKKAGKRRSATTKKPTLPGYEFVEHGAGWKVFRVTYRAPLPGRKWKRKERQYETHLTNKDVEDGKDLFECLKNKFLTK